MVVKKDVSISREIKNGISPYHTTIQVIGAGGAGNNTIQHLMQKNANGIEKIALNTDAQNLLETDCDKRILIGKNLTGGLGAGGDPMVGECAAEESMHIIMNVIGKADMLFLTGGMGGGTGTGALPVIGKLAKEKGILTIAFVTMPFSEEGIIRWENAQIGLEKLRKTVDTIIILENNKLAELFPNLPLKQAFVRVMRFL